MLSFLNTEKAITPEDFLVLKQDSPHLINGKQLTVFGWLQINDNRSKINTLLKLSLSPNPNETNFNKTLENLMILTYTIGEKNQLSLYMADSESTWIRDNQEISLPLNSWIFFSIGFDYEQGKANMYIFFQEKEKQYSNIFNYKMNFPSFFLRQEIKLTVGCFSQDEASLTDKANCLTGRAREFKFFYEFFENPQLLKYMNPDNEEALSFYFDTYTGLSSLKSLETRDKKHQLELIGELKEESKGERGIIFNGQ